MLEEFDVQTLIQSNDDEGPSLQGVPQINCMLVKEIVYFIFSNFPSLNCHGSSLVLVLCRRENNIFFIHPRIILYVTIMSPPTFFPD